MIKRLVFYGAVIFIVLFLVKLSLDSLQPGFMLKEEKDVLGQNFRGVIVPNPVYDYYGKREGIEVFCHDNKLAPYLLVRKGEIDSTKSFPTYLEELWTLSNELKGKNVIPVFLEGDLSEFYNKEVVLNGLMNYEGVNDRWSCEFIIGKSVKILKE